MIKHPVIFGGPSISHAEIEYATSAAAIGWNMNRAGYVRTLEQKMCVYARQRHAVAVSSGSNALHLAFMALGIGPDDEVLVPEIAHISVAAGIAHTGAKVVFCDVDPHTLCLSVPDALAKITDRTKGIVAVHMHGHPCDMVGIMKMAITHGLFVVEDASLAFGAKFKGNPVGSFGNFAIFSFSHDSALTCGEGGVLLTSDERLYQAVLKLGKNGFVNANPFISEALGYNYSMSNLQASVALAQLERAEELLARKKEIFQWYKESFDGEDDLRLNSELELAHNSVTSTVLFFDELPFPRTVFLQKLASFGVYCRPVFYPLSSMPMFERADNPVAYSAGVKAILLPCGHNRTKEEVQYVADIVKALAKGDEDTAQTVRPTGWLSYKEDCLGILDEAKSKGLTIDYVHDEMSYSLVAMTEEMTKRQDIVTLLTKWRQENLEIF